MTEIQVVLHFEKNGYYKALDVVSIHFHTKLILEMCQKVSCYSATIFFLLTTNLQTNSLTLEQKGRLGELNEKGTFLT